MTQEHGTSSGTPADVTVTSAGPLPVSADAIARGYEPERLGFRWYVIFIVALIFSAVVIHVVVWLMLVGFGSAMTRRQDARNSALSPAVPIAPPGPQLQPSPAQGPAPRQPWQDMADYRVHETQVLNSYAYDPKTGELRIPIDRAMQLLVQRGLPTTRPEMRLPPPATRQMNPESSGGR
jgi:hypothetical protein